MKHSAPSPRIMGLIAIAAIGLAMMGCSADIKVTGHALLIGLSDYPDTVNDLPSVAHDIDDMDDLLVGQGWTVTRLEDSAATESAIISGIKNFLASLQKGETALIYYSGHGGLGLNNDAYLVPYDYFPAETALISADELADAMSASAGKNVVVVIDACYSGGFIGPSDAADAAPQDYSLGKGATTELFPFSALSRFGELLVRNSAASGTAAP
ncbi:MAG: caspase family protein, partial [Rectinemataceae bacterium]